MTCAEFTTYLRLPSVTSAPESALMDALAHAESCAECAAKLPQERPRRWLNPRKVIGNYRDMRTDPTK